MTPSKASSHLKVKTMRKSIRSSRTSSKSSRTLYGASSSVSYLLLHREKRHSFIVEVLGGDSGKTCQYTRPCGCWKSNCSSPNKLLLFLCYLLRPHQLQKTPKRMAHIFSYFHRTNSVTQRSKAAVLVRCAQ